MELISYFSISRDSKKKWWFYQNSQLRTMNYFPTWMTWRLQNRPQFLVLFLLHSFCIICIWRQKEKKVGHKHTNRRTYIDNLSRNIFVWMYIEEVEVDNPLIGLYASPKWVNREIEQTLKHIFDVFWIFLAARSRLYRLFCPSVSMCMYFRNDG